MADDDLVEIPAEDIPCVSCSIEMCKSINSNSTLLCQSVSVAMVFSTCSAPEVSPARVPRTPRARASITMPSTGLSSGVRAFDLTSPPL
ncbi:hypothetical protein PG988_006618 [Apiospora saccharicola]